MKRMYINGTSEKIDGVSVDIAYVDDEDVESMELVGWSVDHSYDSNEG